MTARRTFLTMAAAAPFAAWAGGAQAAGCYDPAKLPLSQKSMRRSLNYLEVAPEPAKKRCSLCAFFTGTQEGCGNCQLLSGAAVNAGGVCNNFAPKG